MKSILLTYIDRFRHDRRQRIVFGSFVVVLAVIVAMSVYWQLHLNGIAMTNATYCGYEEHTHTEECYEKTLMCGLEESEGHTHDESCYEEQQILICELEESEGHTHTEECYDEEGNLICGLEESEGHTHTDECYETQSVLICELEESEGHTHTDECYEYTLICGLEEHIHTTECMVDETADLEDYSIWEATIPALTGDLRTDVVNIAYSQLGYTESVANYVLGEDGITHMGYTRYGAWYGSAYSDWDSMFTAFCLDFAGIADEFTYNAGAYAWSVDLTTLGYYQTADVYMPSIGDVVFIDTDDDGKANVTAIVVAVDETAETITVIQGNYAVLDADGDTVDTVSLVTYSTVVETEEETATEPEIVSLAAEYGTEETEATEDEEITPVILGYADISYGIVSEETDEETEETEETDEDSDDETEEDVELDEDGEELTEEVTEEVAEEAVEEVAEEVTSEETGLLTASAEEVTEEETEEETATSLTYEEWSSKVISLYTAAMSAADATEACDAWDALMAEWDNIDAALAEETITEEEWSALNALMDTYSAEVYTYFTETLGYDPYGIMTLEETNSSSATDTLYTDLTDTALENSTVSWTASNVSYANGSFTMALLTNFTISSTDVTSNAAYYIYLPEGFTVADSMLDYAILGLDSSGNEAFHYYFEVDDDGNYYIKIVFDVDSYVTSNGGQEGVTLTGTINYTQYTIDVEDIDDAYDNGYVVFDESLDVKISVEEVSHKDTDSWILDLAVSKSAGSYNSTTNSITYTVTISSKLGTGEITLSDVLSLYNNLDYTEDLSISSITIDGVAYKVYTTDQNGNMSWVDADYSGTIEYSSTIDADSGSLTITLPQLYGADEDGDYTQDAFVVTYTVYFDSTSGAVNSSVINDAYAESTKDGDTQSGEASRTVKVTSTNVSKSGNFDSSTGYITWTITYNANSANIAGNSIVDLMLADAVGDVTVTSKDSSGDETTSAAGEDYTINYDSEGNISSIVFNAIEDTDDDGEADSNTRTYTITYKTAVGMGTQGNVTNEVDVEDENEKVIDEGEASTGVWNLGSLSKTVEAGAKSSDGNTRVLNWTSSITVPQSGISAGTVIADYLNSSWNYTKLSNAKQWFTYDQLKSLMDDLATITVTYTYTDKTSGDTVTTTTDYTYVADYSIQVYGFTSVDDTGEGEWIDYATIAADASSYSNYVFTAWKITLINDIAGPGTITLNYSSTADISNITTTQSYTNYIYVGDKEASATYVERNPVYKTDGNSNTNDTTPTVTDGVITWKVYVSVDGLTDTSGDIVITDTLPSDVSLDSLVIQLGSTGKAVTLDVASGTSPYTVTLNGYDVTVTISENSDGTTNVVATIPYDAYSGAIGTSNPYLILTYTTSIDNWDTEVDANTTVVVHTMNNKVVVTLDSEEYGKDEQQQKVTHEYEETGGTTDFDHEVIDKSADLSGSGIDNIIKYEVFINLDGDMLNSGNTLTFTDILKSVYTPTMETDLIYSSVHFYYLYELVEVDNGDGTYNYVYYTYTYSTDEQTGDVIKTVASTVTVYSGVDEISTWASEDSSIYVYTESDGTTETYYYTVLADIAWDYSSAYSETWSTDLYDYILTAEVPDCTPMLLKYSYYVTASGSGYWVTLNNTATLTGDSGTEGSDSDNEAYNYEETKSSGSITNAGGLTVIKSGEHTSDFIKGTTFALYKYNSTTGEFEQVVDDSGDPVTYTTNDNGSFTVVPGTDDDSDGVIDTWYSWYSPNTLYYLIETSTPSDYLLDEDTKYYFYWYDASDTADPTYDNMAYPDDWDSDTTVNQVTTTSATRLNIYNTPITSFNLKKVSTSDGTTTISGAVFALYEWNETKGTWVRIGTYVTDSNGEIIITFDEELFSFNKAYMLKEITPADGYNIGYGDDTVFYFWWNSSLYEEHGLPDDWGTDPDGTITGETDLGTTYETAVDIAAESKDVTATNTKTSTMATVTKAWVDSNGNVITDASTLSSYSAEVQLYYYLTDSAGNAYDSTASSTSTELITISTSSAVADTDVIFYSFTPTSTLSMTGTKWYSLSNTYGLSVSSLISAMSNTDYDDLYIEVEVSGGDQPTGMQLIFQANVDGYPTIASVTPYTIVTEEGTTNYTVIYRVSKILAAIEASGYSLDNIYGGVSLALNSSQEATVTSIKVVGSGSEVKSSDEDWSVTLKTGSYQSWQGTFWQNSTVASALQQSGAVILVTYSCDSLDTEGENGQLVVGVQTKDGDDAAVSHDGYVTVSSTTSSEVTVAVPVSSLNNYSNIDWDNFDCIYVNSKGMTGTVTNITVVVPASSSTTYRTYYVADEDPTEITLTYSDWYDYKWAFKDWYYGNSSLKSYLQTDGAVIRVYYTTADNANASYILNTVIQSWNNETNSGGYLSGTAVTLSDTSGYVDFYVEDFTADSNFTWDLYNAIMVYGSSGVTVTDIKILLPYDVTQDITGVIASSDISVTLYDPDLSSSIDIYNYITYNGTWYEDTYWNKIISTEGEAASGYTYSYSDVNESDGDELRGFAFFDAIYSDLDSTVVVTLTVTSEISSPVDLLSHLNLVIQGDASVEYGSIANVEPYSVEYNTSTKVATITYLSSDIRSALASATGHYASAAEACADYNAICLALSGSYYTTEFTATVTDFDVISTTFNTSETYTYSNLLGTTTYGGTPYYTTDDNGDVTYYTATLNSSNNWTYSYANLPISFVDADGTTWYYNYYFVETSATGSTTAYTTTYSQTEGMNGGGEVVILNIETGYVLPSAGGAGMRTLYEFGVMLILLALAGGAGAYYNISRMKNSLVSEPLRDEVTHSDKHKRVPDGRNRKFVNHRTVRRGDSRAGPDEDG